jgi:hypothetical protein
MNPLLLQFNNRVATLAFFTWLLLFSFALQAQPRGESVPSNPTRRTTIPLPTQLPTQIPTQTPTNTTPQTGVTYAVPSSGSSGQDANSPAEIESQVVALKKKVLNYYLSVDGTYTILQSDFRTRFADSANSTRYNAYGFGLGFGYILDPYIPVSFGLNLGFQFNSSDERVSYANYTLNNRVFRDTNTTKSSTTFFPLSLSMRVEPYLKFARPYIEGLVGFTFISSSYEQTIRSNIPVSSNQPSESSTSSPLHLGIGAGVKIKLVDIIDLPDTYSRIYFNISSRYLYGKGTDIVSYKRNIDDPNTFTKNTTKTDDTNTLTTGIGFTFEF